MTVVEYDGRIVVVDCGLRFPTAEMMGIDVNRTIVTTFAMCLPIAAVTGVATAGPPRKPDAPAQTAANRADPPRTGDVAPPRPGEKRRIVGVLEVRVVERTHQQHRLADARLAERDGFRELDHGEAGDDPVAKED